MYMYNVSTCQIFVDCLIPVALTRVKLNRRMSQLVTLLMFLSLHQISYYRSSVNLHSKRSY